MHLAMNAAGKTARRFGFTAPLQARDVTVGAVGLFLLFGALYALVGSGAPAVSGGGGGGHGGGAHGLRSAPCPATPEWSSGAGKKVLVTGAAGFIGSHVARFAAEELGMTVIGVDDMSGGFEYNLHPSFTFVKGDLQDEAFVKRLFAEHGRFECVRRARAQSAAVRRRCGGWGQPLLLLLLLLLQLRPAARRPSSVTPSTAPARARAATSTTWPPTRPRACRTLSAATTTATTWSPRCTC